MRLHYQKLIDLHRQIATVGTVSWHDAYAAFAPNEDKVTNSQGGVIWEPHTAVLMSLQGNADSALSLFAYYLRDFSLIVVAKNGMWAVEAGKETPNDIPSKAADKVLAVALVQVFLQTYAREMIARIGQITADPIERDSDEQE